jgi:hypothetical protein
MWAADENNVIGAQDVREVITWADEEARSRKSTYTLWAVVARGSEVWLAGIAPPCGRDQTSIGRIPRT